MTLNERLKGKIVPDEPLCFKVSRDEDDYYSFDFWCDRDGTLWAIDMVDDIAITWSSSK